MTKGDRKVSIHSDMVSAINSFLSDCHMTCSITEQGLVELIPLIASYKEEGRVLFPEIYVCDNLHLMLKTLGTYDLVTLGEKPKDVYAMKLALKKCAPLAQRGWNMFIAREDSKFTYGVFRSAGKILGVPVREILITTGGSAVPVFMIHQLTDRLIKISSSSGINLFINLRGTSSELDPSSEVRLFIESLSSGCEERLKDRQIAFLEWIMKLVLTEGHGSLMAQLSERHGDKIPQQLADGTLVSPLIDIPSLINDFVTRNDFETYGRIQATISLVAEMMRSDGVTLFTNSGKLLSFSVFIKLPDSDSSNPKPVGGARSRTFEALCSMIPETLSACLMISQDGGVRYKGEK